MARWKRGHASARDAGSHPLFRGTDFAWGVGAQTHFGNIGGRLEYERFDFPSANGARVYSPSVVPSFL